MSEHAIEIPLTGAGNLPCPFCGGLALSRISPKKDPAIAWITCDACGATGPNVQPPERGWNGRQFGPKDWIDQVLNIRAAALLEIERLNRKL